MTHVIVVIGAGLIGQAIARRVSAGKHVLVRRTCSEVKWIQEMLKVIHSEA